jgi:WhiB family transcriptional regulator, redox-sensing transcriptional regulator
LQAAYAGGGRPDLEPTSQPASSPLERIEQVWRRREVGHGERLDHAVVAREVGVGRAYATQTLAALRGGELTNTERITQLWQVVERDGGQRLDAAAVAWMLGVREGRVRQVLGPLRTQQRLAADQHSSRLERLSLVPGEGQLGWMDQAACKGMPTDRFFPETGEQVKVAEARAICATCQVQDPCRELAVRGADSAETDHGIFGGTIPKERSHLRPNQFPEPSAYRQDRAVAEAAHELASRVGLRQAAKQLGSLATRSSVRLRAVQRRAERAQRLVAERASRPERRQAERTERQARARASRAERSSRPHHAHRDEREVYF